MSKNKKRLLLSSLCVILLLALIGGSMAWLLTNENVSITYGNSIFCEAGDSLEISLIDENGAPVGWSSTIDYSSGKFTTVDISGDGCNLYRPTEINEMQQPLNFVEAVSSLEDINSYDYVEMVIAFRSLSKMNVYLSEESFIAPVNTNKADSNIYGKFSNDYIAGAMRVAVVDESGQILKMLWAPNSQYHLIRNLDENGNEKGTYEFNPDSKVEQAYKYYAMADGELKEQEVPADLYASKQFVIDSTGAKKGWTGNAPVLASLVPESEGARAQQTVRIRIWFEGTDREAHQALAGGNVNVKLKFIGISKETETKIDDIDFDKDSGTFTNLEYGVFFSTDGRMWEEYKAGVNLPTLESGSSIYIKYPETSTHFECVKKFTMN